MKVEINEETMKDLIATLIQSARSAGSAQMQEDVSVGMLWKYLDENTITEKGEEEGKEGNGDAETKGETAQ